MAQKYRPRTAPVQMNRLHPDFSIESELMSFLCDVPAPKLSLCEDLGLTMGDLNRLVRKMAPLGIHGCRVQGYQAIVVDESARPFVRIASDQYLERVYGL